MDTREPTTEVFRPWFGRVLTVAVGLVCAVSVVAVAASSGITAMAQVLPWAALAAGACWALFWRPEVRVDDAGVHVVNVLRTVHVPWPSIHAVDTKWALTLVTAHGRFTAWAAPAPGVHQAVRATRQDVEHLPMSALSGDGIRPGDLPSSPSGDAALLVRQRWDQLRRAGHLDDARLEHRRAPVRWHTGTLVAAVALLLLGVALAPL